MLQWTLMEKVQKATSRLGLGKNFTVDFNDLKYKAPACRLMAFSYVRFKCEKKRMKLDPRLSSAVCLFHML